MTINAGKIYTIKSMALNEIKSRSEISVVTTRNRETFNSSAFEPLNKLHGYFESIFSEIINKNVS
ncbi:hypothetical protein JCM31826_17020 [Thermaurantimonas aggregans]|uniref:Uncharacterized protein n=1 Tax=Thermaurantimonas aggregans TaxID=2173829 RepID=A0A401XMH8_9FLAO|nr:hypothetical protein JCM31826_17020 [Thermaurantimonas aggregans]